MGVRTAAAVAAKGGVSSRRSRLWVEALVLAPALIMMARHLHDPLDGNHYFRQAHVAANIERFVSDGLSLRPATYNFDVPYPLFDFPAYQLLVAAVARHVAIGVLPLARLVNLAFFTASGLLVIALLAASGVRGRRAVLTVVFFAFAPLNLFYFGVPMVDGMGVCLALMSLLGLQAWEKGTTPGVRGAGFALMATSGVLSTLIKNPVFLPFAVGIGLYLLRSQGPRRLHQPPSILFFALILATVIAFKYYSNTVNEVRGFFAGGASEAYFGTPADRLDLEAWGHVASVLAFQVLNPLTAALSVWGIVSIMRDRHAPARWLWLGLLAGSLLALLLLFNRHRWHDYYQLPLVLPCAFFASWGTESVLSRVERGSPRTLRRVAASTLLLLVVGVTLCSSIATWTEMWSPRTTVLARRGDWIRAHTGRRDFIVYLSHTAVGDWSPAFLYFAKRDGYNLSVEALSREELTRIAQEFGTRYANLFVYCPCPGASSLARRLETLGADLVADGERSSLFKIPLGLVTVPKVSQAPAGGRFLW